MEGFIARQNIKHYRQALERGADGTRRNMLVRRLIEEECKLGFTREQLGRLDRHISRLSKIIARQAELTRNMREHGHSCERAEMVLASLNALMGAYITHRARIVTALE